MLPGDLRFRWTLIWDHERQRKEAGLMWQIWHMAVAVNVWHRKIAPNINVCGSGHDETMFHRFWDCDLSYQVWHSITRLLEHLATPNSDVV
jgi:hypothetical protein